MCCHRCLHLRCCIHAPRTLPHHTGKRAASVELLDGTRDRCLILAWGLKIPRLSFGVRVAKCLSTSYSIRGPEGARFAVEGREWSCFCFCAASFCSESTIFGGLGGDEAVGPGGMDGLPQGKEAVDIAGCL